VAYALLVAEMVDSDEPSSYSEAICSINFAKWMIQ